VFQELAGLDAVLHRHRAELGDDYMLYRNHAHRVAHLCLMLAPTTAEQREKIGLAAAFHDLGIWSAATFDYIEHSVSLAARHLESIDRAAWLPAISAMIRQHHKLTPYRGDDRELVESFRRADWIDVTRGLVRFGVPRTTLDSLHAIWPAVGFHRRLLGLELRQLRTRPWNPVPMLRL
jgi:hypothetical protein